jgi:hypothetical protein
VVAAVVLLIKKKANVRKSFIVRGMIAVRGVAVNRREPLPASNRAGRISCYGLPERFLRGDLGIRGLSTREKSPNLLIPAHSELETIYLHISSGLADVGQLAVGIGLWLARPCNSQ